MRPLRNYKIKFSNRFSVSFRAKKVTHQTSTIFCQNAGSDFDLMIQRATVAKSKNAFDRAETFVECSENKASDSRVDERASAHRARFYRRIKRGFRQPIIADFSGSLSQNQNFR